MRHRVTFAVAVVLASTLSCTTRPPTASPVDLTSFDGVRQVALDHGLTCAARGEVRGGASAQSCDGPGTTLNFVIGDGFDGVAYNGGTCVDRSHVHGWIWAGDGYWIALHYGGEAPSPDQMSLHDTLGVDAWCSS